MVPARRHGRARGGVADLLAVVFVHFHDDGDALLKEAVLLDGWWE